MTAVAEVMLHGSGKRLLLPVLALGLLAFCGAPAWAQAAQCGKDRKVGGKALDELTWKQLNGVYEDVGKEKYLEAYNELQKMLAHAGRDTYLKAIINQALAQVEWSRENYDASLAYFEKAVELDALPDEPHFALMYQIAQLYFMKERYQDALDRLDLWFCTAPKNKITAAAWVLKASILLQMKNYRQTLQAIDTAIAMEPAPTESWYQLKLAAQYELEQYPQAAATLELMISHWPEKKQYWIQLAQTWLSLKQDDKALAIAALAYRKKLLDSQADIALLSSLYANANVPYKAAAVLQQGIEDGVVESSEKFWTAVADSWYAAEEMDKALAAYEKAGTAASSGDIDLRRAYILVDLERWSPARQALDAAITKGGLKEWQVGEAYLLRGMVEFNLENYDQASSDWDRASAYPRSRDAAQQWLNHLREERKRRAS
jgi:tetratricopeptide (TPR) repeat protein